MAIVKKKRLTKVEKAKLAKKRARDREYRFNKLSPEQKRVTIARDVLQQLATKKLVAHAGTWFTLHSEPVDVYNNDDARAAVPRGSDLRDSLENVASCSACALGAIFTSCVKRADKFKVPEVDHHGTDATVEELNIDHFSDYLKQFFSEDQLSLIETSFELGMGMYLNGFNSETRRSDAKYFGKIHGENVSDSENRMVAIMNNIIANDGRFNPPRAAHFYDPFIKIEKKIAVNPYASGLV